MTRSALKDAYSVSDYVPGNVLLSQDPAVQVPSALKSLTSVFGMGTGVTSSPSSPDYSSENVVPSKLDNIE